MNEDLIKTVYVSMCFLLLISEVVLFLITKHNASKNKTKSDKGTFFLISAATLFCININAIFGDIIFKWLLPQIFLYIGIISMIAGIVIRWIAVFTLKKYFSYTVVVKSEQKIIKTGLYKYLRHPAYTGYILMLVSLQLMIQSVIALLIAAIVAFGIFSRRIYVEERELIKNFGDEYIEYSKKTWRVIPYIW